MFWIVLMRWSQKLFFKEWKNIILMYFSMKSILKNNHNHTLAGGQFMEEPMLCQTYKNSVWKRGLTRVFKFYFYFLLKINFFMFWIVLMRWSQKLFFKEWKNIILMYFNMKSILKNNYNHTPKQTFRTRLHMHFWICFSKLIQWWIFVPYFF
jgi:hypothetical protein